MPDPKLLKKEIPLKWVYPEGLMPRFVQNMTCSYQDGIFMISFFEIWQPEMRAKTPEDRKREFDGIKEVEATCVSRILVTPKKMRDFIKAMTEGVSNAEKIVQSEKENEKKE